MSKKQNNININLKEVDTLIDETSSKTIYSELYKDKIVQKLEIINNLSSELNEAKKLDEPGEIQVELETIEFFYENELNDIEYIIGNGLNIKVVKESQEFQLLTHNFYKVRNNLLDLKTYIVDNKITDAKKTLEETKVKTSTLEDKFEGIGATAITMITSIGVITSSITAIDKMEPKYIPLFIISMVWLGMTFIVFINKLFSKKDKNSIDATLLYSAVTIAFFIILWLTCNGGI